MKTLFSFLAALVISIGLAAQTVTIEVKGTRNRQIIVDGQYYNLQNYNSTTGYTPIVLTGLSTGQHTLGIVRSNTSTVATKNFYLRQGYDLTLIVNSNGAVTTRESIVKTTIPGAGHMVPLADADFNILYNQVLDERRVSMRNSLVREAFTEEDYFFTTTQARQLLQLVNSQAQRLALAKLVYPKITDPANFTRVNDLLNTRNQRELAAYVRNYDLNNPGQGGSTGVAMSDRYFNILYEHAQDQWSGSARQSYLLSAFNNTNNYFTTTQARKLILLMNGESDRLQLAKASYRSIVDKANFSVITNLLSSQAARNDLVAYIRAYNNGSTVTRVAMSDAAFNTMYRDVANSWGLGVKMNRLSEIFNNLNNHFSTAQAEQLIRLVSSESNRLTLAKAAFDNIVDPSNFHLLYDVLASQSSRDELDLYVKNNTSAGTGYGVRTLPMSDAEFNRIYEEVAESWGFGVKMNKLTEIFNNAGYAFSTMQARQLVLLVSAESNRLQLAKASYDNITDPENFTAMYDVFNEQASRDELAEYVRSRN